MVARKKVKARAKRKQAPAAKPVRRKKSPRTVKKTAPARKASVKSKVAVARRAPGKRKPVTRSKPKPKAAVRTAPTPEKRPAIRSATPVAPAVPVAAHVPAEGEQRIGIVTHYYSHLSVAVIRLESGSVRVGDTIRISGHTTDFRQRVDSLQVEHESVNEVGPGDDFGLKVIDHAREHDVVYKLPRS